MRLVIRAMSLQDEPLARTIVCEFDERGGTVGRSDINTLTLPDPGRHISRRQGEIAFQNGAFCVRNVGSANPLIVNGHPLLPGEVAPIRDGDDVVIGRYTLKATVHVSADAKGGQQPFIPRV